MIYKAACKGRSVAARVGTEGLLVGAEETLNGYKFSCRDYAARRNGKVIMNIEW
jgi:hypothetical protein